MLSLKECEKQLNKQSQTYTSEEVEIIVNLLELIASIELENLLTNIEKKEEENE
jgi:hypothetical protein